MPVEAVQEFQLLTSQFDAEFGMASGGVVNSVSKQGTNQFHGSAFMFYQDENLTTRDYFAETRRLREARDPAAAVGRHARRADPPATACTSSRASSASCSTAAAPPTSRAGPTWSGPTSRRPGCGTPTCAPTTRSTPPTPGASAGCARPPRSPCRSTPRTIRVPLRGRNRRRLDAGRQPQLDLRIEQGQHLQGLGGQGRRVLRQPALQRRRRPEDAAADAESPQLQRSAEPARQPPARHRLRRRQHLRLVPAQQVGRRSRPQGRRQLHVFVAALQDFGNLNGTFTIPSDLPFNAADPRTYPERLSIRVGNPSTST